MGGTECQMLLRVLTLVFGVVVTCAASELPGNKSYVVKWETSTEKLNWADSRSRCLERPVDKAKKQFALTQTQEPDVAALVKKTELSHEQRINIFKLVQLHSGDLAIKKAMAEMNAAVADEKITTKDEVPVADMLLF